MTTALSLAVEEATEALLAAGWAVAVAESCTGGLVAQQLTERPGASHWFERGWITYSNAAKVELLGVSPDTLAQHGAVSAEVVGEMVHGALRYSTAQIALAITGVAGPGGGSLQKPVGLVWLGFAVRNQAPSIIKQQWAGDRAQVRIQAATFACQEIARLVRQSLQERLA